ncbi:MAG: TetR/AcrR family transcriptional regulator [Sphingobium limneticum]
MLKNKEEMSRPERLIEVATAAWELRGHAAISARYIAEAADQRVSSIYYHFDDLERLLIESQAQAVDMARRWCVRQLDAMPATLLPAMDAMPPLLAAVIQDWATSQRRLAFAWRECLLIAARNPAYIPALDAWESLWGGFWKEVCQRCGVAEFATLTYYQFASESLLHLLRTDPLVDSACLYELCRGWGNWLGGKPAEEGPWRRHARTEAMRTAAPVQQAGDVGDRISAAAADLVTRQGPASLTHRAVAAEAGLTLGAVSYHYRTSVDLIQAAFEVIYHRVMDRNLTAHSDEDGYAQYRERSLAAVDSPQRAMGRQALNELLVAVARDDTLKGFAAELRYLRGRTARRFLEALLGRDDAGSPLEAALVSNLLFGIGHCYMGLDEAGKRRATERDLGLLETLILTTRSADHGVIAPPA